MVYVLLDLLPPQLAIISPPDNGYTNQNPVTVSGTTTPDTVSLMVNGVPATFNKTNPLLWTWTASGVALSEGLNTMTAQAVNTQGQLTTLSLTVILVLFFWY